MPQLTDYLPEANRQHFAQLQAILRHAGLAFTVNPYLVRGSIITQIQCLNG